MWQRKTFLSTPLVSPDYKPSMGEYPAGGVKPKHNVTKDKETHKYEQEARKYEKEQRKKYEKDNEGHEKDRKEEYKHRENKTGKYPTPPNMPYQHPPAGCPPCPCAQPWPQMPHPNNDQSRFVSLSLILMFAASAHLVIAQLF
jgi:hypothetical protein